MPEIDEPMEMISGEPPRDKGLIMALREISLTAGKIGERGTTGDGHQRCIEIAKAALKDAGIELVAQ